MAAMIPDEKKEEVRGAADIVEVVEDYVKLKRSGRSWKGLCPFHDEKTASFHVTPDLGIYKCFGCGESGDVFNFVMAMEGVGFVEAMRSLADRYGVSLPEKDDEEFDEQHHLREGIYYALKYAGVFFHRHLVETDEAEKAREYLQQRGYDRSIIKKYGLGYAPAGGDKLYKTAIDSGIKEEYLLESGLVKPSNRDDGFYDAFRGRLMFPIFNPSGKVIAYAGRVLGEEKAAKYINSPQTKVYDKSSVLYGINFAKNEIRKTDEVILVEGYTDVISLQQKGIDNVAASSGTSLTPRQMKLLHRYGDTITMIYDSDSAGQRAMKRGINIALREGMDVNLLELPKGEDPDSFVRQFGKDSFLEMKKEESENFLTYQIHKAKEEGRWENPAEKKNVISEILESIAHMPDPVSRETFVQHLNSKAKVGDRALFDELGKIRKDLKEERQKAKRREKKRREREARRSNRDQDNGRSRASQPHTVAFNEQTDANQQDQRQSQPRGKRPNYEKELIRLMLIYDRDIIDYIGSQCNGQQFEDKQLRKFYEDIIARYKDEKEVSIEVYADREHPYPKLVGEVALEEHSVSERHHEKVGVQYKKDKNPYRTAKGALKALKIHYLDRLQVELYERYNSAEDEERKKVMKAMKEAGRQRTILQQSPIDELFPDPDSDAAKKVSDKVFEYKMKHERNQ
ncbi:DNA primase [Fodinibius salinus]|uniref:DNA primase n=1 Tax=Fodinibius salinus TaxID=860790 RepID=A0A5D3YNY2_9BACT|nr:DNA primase [Fodinibius salinus]TYP95517.1 DNA primase [Fodinibius salinus]